MPKLSIASFVQAMTGRSVGNADDQAAAKKAAADKAQLETNLRKQREIQQRLKSQGLVSADVEMRIRDDQERLDDGLAMQDLKAQQQQLSIGAAISAKSVEICENAETRLMQKRADFPVQHAQGLQLLDDQRRRIAALQRDDLRKLLDDQFAPGWRREIEDVDASADGADLTRRIEVLDAILGQVGGFNLRLREAEALELSSGEVSRLLYAKFETVHELGRPEAQRYARKKLDELRLQQEQAAKVADVRELGQRSNKMKALWDELLTLNVESSPVIDKQVERSEQRLGALDGLARQLPTAALQTSAAKALADTRQRMDMATLGFAADGKPATVHVGADKMTLRPRELLRGIDGGLKSLEAVLKAPAGSPERKLLESEGPERLAEVLARVSQQQVAFGIAPPPISAAEAYALNLYTKQEYEAMNAARLGKNSDPRVLMLNEICDEALRKLPPYPKAAWPVFRFERAWDQEVVDKRYKKGSKFICGVMWSTGARGGADVKQGGGPTFTHVIYGHSGRDVAALSANSHEGSKDDDQFKTSASKAKKRDVVSGKGEVLFAATSRFEVQDRKNPSKDPEALKYTDSFSGLPIRTKLKELQGE